MFELEKNYPLLKMAFGIFLVSVLIGSCVSRQDTFRESPNPAKIHVWLKNDTNQSQKIKVFIEQILNKRGFNLIDKKTADIIVALRDVTNDKPPSHTASFQNKTIVQVQVLVADVMNKDLLTDQKEIESQILESIREEIMKETNLVYLNTPFADNNFIYLDLF